MMGSIVSIAVVTLMSVPLAPKNLEPRLSEIEIKNIEVDLQYTARQILTDLEDMTLENKRNQHGKASEGDLFRPEQSRSPTFAQTPKAHAQPPK